MTAGRSRPLPRSVPRAGLRGLVSTPAGRFSPLKAVVLALCVLPAAVLAAQWATGLLGPRALLAIIRGTGLWTIRFLLLSLAVTPARAVLDWPRVVMLRRMLGVTAACYAGTHLLLYVVQQRFDLLHVASEIALRFYLTIGFVALLGLIALAVTSTNGWQKRLGRRWKSLHRWVYAIAVLAILHFFLQAKADVSGAVMAAGVFFWLMLWRAEPRRWQTRRLPLPGLAILAALLTAATEALWYGLRTGISGWRVLDANLAVARGLRPAPWVAILGLLVLAVALARLLWRRREAGRNAAV